MMIEQLLAQEEAELEAAKLKDRPKGRLVRPFAPVRRLCVDPFFRHCVNPPATYSSARKDKCVRAFAIEHGKFDVDIGWCGHPNGLPLRVRFLNRRHEKSSG